MAAGVPVTELPNELTNELDTVSPEGIVRLLQGAESQVFSGWRQEIGLNDEHLIQCICAVAREASSLLISTDDHVIVMSGSGTSGRIAYCVARAFNRACQGLGIAPCFRYTASGGDEALMLSRELPEDNPAQGVADLRAHTDGRARVLFIGITCGLSAPYAAGQVEYAMAQPNFTTVMIGFNPSSLARDRPVEGWDKTVRQVVQALEARQREGTGRHFLLNPVIGPEPVTASSRMKGGSATKILLDTVLGLAFDAAAKRDPTLITPGGVALALQRFEATHAAAYRPTREIGTLVDAAARAVRAGGHVYYVGAGCAGVMAIIDASEMVDTYGCEYDEIRAFVEGGWATMGNRDGDIGAANPPSGPEDDRNLLRLSWTDFAASTAPRLTERDVVLVIRVAGDDADGEAYRALGAALAGTAATVALMSVEAAGAAPLPLPDFATSLAPSRVLRVVLPALGLPLPSSVAYAELALKYILNVITTGAEVMKGLVFGNKMVNLTVSNNKLFHRSVDLVRDFMSVSREDAYTALLKAIYNGDVTPEVRALPESRHIVAATPQKNIVPTAMLLASGRFDTVGACREALQREPVVRRLIASLSPLS